MDITKLSDIELKAVAFDIIQQQQVLSQNLQTIYAELQRRQQQTPRTDANTVEATFEPPTN